MEGGSIHWIEVLRALIHIWQIEGEKLKAVTDFLLLGSKITVDSDWDVKSEDDCFLAGKP